MCEPARLISLYKAVIEQGLGVTAHPAEGERALMFTYDDVTYVLRNTAPGNPGLLDITVYLSNDEADGLKEEACRQVVRAVPCLKAWVDSDGDVVLNVQTLTGPMGLMPTIAILKEILPETLHMLRYAAGHVSENVVLAGIVSASEILEEPARHRQGPTDRAA